MQRLYEGACSAFGGYTVRKRRNGVRKEKRKDRACKGVLGMHTGARVLVCGLGGDD